MKKGFTLVELLAVIVILALILVISIPQVLKAVDNSRSNVYERQKDLIVNATRTFMVNNTELLPMFIGQEKILEIDQLKEVGLIDETISSQTGAICSGYVLIDRNINYSYQYKPFLKCGNDYISEGFVEDLSTLENIIIDPTLKYGESQSQWWTWGSRFDSTGQYTKLIHTRGEDGVRGMLMNNNLEIGKTYMLTIIFRYKEGTGNRARTNTTDMANVKRYLNGDEVSGIDIFYPKSSEWNHFILIGEATDINPRHRFYLTYGGDTVEIKYTNFRLIP